MTAERRGWHGFWVGLTMALLAGCSSATSPPARSGGAASSAGTTVQELAAGAGHTCIISGSGRPVVAWSRLRNPILSYPSSGVKDEALIWAGGEWHMLFSMVTDDPSLPGGVHWNVATATSPDLVHWSEASPWPSQPGVLGVASPDITRSAAGDYLVTYQSDPGASGPTATQSRLFYRASTNLRSWSAPRPLAQALAPSPDDRMIDGAFVDTGHQLLLGFKFSSPGQPDVFEIARSTTSSPGGPWQLVGRPDITVVGGTIENYEFVTVGGKWRLVATSNNLDQPWIFTLVGAPSSSKGWLDWTGGYLLDVPAEAFNRGPGISSIGFEHANSAFLCDADSLAGHYSYLLYAGSSELTQFGAWGHAKIGIARSTDLVHWHVPPD